jgi:glycosyltransferase involved in cell wall biosynthesis
MKACTLKDLPSPPPKRSGWPWNEESVALPAAMPAGGAWPMISIVIPSYNQGRFIEETIRSILLQGYPNFELHVIDGGSTDETVDILRKYEPWITSWVSEKDGGQSDAINKGFERCSGDLFNWMCSDDFLTKNALQKVAVRFSIKAIDVVAGACFCQYDDEPEKSEVRQVDWNGWELTPYAAAIWQPSCYFRRTLVSRRNLVRRDLHYCMDRELWAYLCSKSARWEWMEDCLSVYRFTGENKSVVGRQKIINELDIIYRYYVKETVALPLLLRKWWLPLVLTNIRHSSSAIRMLSRGGSRLIAMGLLIFYPKVRVRALQREFYEYSVW